MSEKKIILFDGVCNLCHSSVQFIKKNDRTDHFVFFSLQSAEGKKLLTQHFNDSHFVQSIIFIDGKKIYTKSTAALEISKYLSPPIKWLYIFKIIPPVIRDAMYDLIARYRYRVFGYHSACPIETDSKKKEV